MRISRKRFSGPVMSVITYMVKIWTCRICGAGLCLMLQSAAKKVSKLLVG